MFASSSLRKRKERKERMWVLTSPLSSEAMLHWCPLYMTHSDFRWNPSASRGECLLRSFLRHLETLLAATQHSVVVVNSGERTRGCATPWPGCISRRACCPGEASHHDSGSASCLGSGRQVHRKLSPLCGQMTPFAQSLKLLLEENRKWCHRSGAGSADSKLSTTTPHP